MQADGGGKGVMVIRGNGDMWGRERYCWDMVEERGWEDAVGDQLERGK